MKRYRLAAVVLLSLLVVTVGVYADDGYRRGGGGQNNYCPNCGQRLSSGDYPMGPGMMYRGRDMGPGMMHRGWGMGYHEGMRGGPGYGYGQSEECRKFLEESVEMRREMNSKRFEYSEKMRDPGSSPEELGKLQKELYDLEQKIYKNAPRDCWR